MFSAGRRKLMSQTSEGQGDHKSVGGKGGVRRRNKGFTDKVVVLLEGAKIG